MSGDVQPRKRKDKKRKKDELGVEEPRGTAAVLGEGDVFMHSQYEHGTGGHWCAKIIFFSLLAILIALIGLIILENRGLTELEANAVESRYSGVLQGWLEDSPDDNHHDKHTLDLKHHDDDDEINQNENNLRNELDQDHDTEDSNDEADDQSNEDDENGDDEEDNNLIEDDNHNHEDDEDNDHSHEDDEDDEHDNNDDNTSQEDNSLDGFDSIDYKGTHEDEDSKEHGNNYQESEENVEENYEDKLGKYVYEENFDSTEYDDDDYNDNKRNVNNNEEQLDDQSNQIDDFNNDDIEKGQKEVDDEYLEYSENYENEDDNYKNVKNHIRRDFESDEDFVMGEEDSDVEVEKIEKEYSDEELDESLTEIPVTANKNDLKEEDKLNDNISEEDEDEEFLSPEDVEELPVVEPITAPRGKPFIELEDEISSEKPPNTLAEEEEYEKQQAELSRQKEQASHKDGGNNMAEEWPGEPSEAYWRQYLDQAEQHLQQGEWSAAEARAGAAAVRGSGRARYVRARALDAAAEVRRDNTLLSKAIAAYLELLKMNERLSDQKLKEIAERTLDRIRFRGNYMGAEPVYRLLINRFPEDPSHRNNLSISFLMANRPDLAEDVLKETLQRWPNDRVALAHLGFVLKNRHNRLEEAVDLFQKALEGDIGPANEPRFYYHLGDALLLLGRYEEAHQVHVRGAKLGHFLSPSQRSLYNVERLKSRPWWNIEETPYTELVRSLEKSWREILKEGNAARSVYEKEKEGLKERGEWSQLDLFVRGREVPERCERAPVTCAIVRQETAAAGCRRGQVKFSLMEAGTHVRPHVGPTNCRLRMHLALSNTKDAFIRVDQEIRQWQTGKVLVFDDSFEHEVWHNGTGTRLVLIVDVWHPDLTSAERRQLPSI